VLRVLRVRLLSVLTVGWFVRIVFELGLDLIVPVNFEVVLLELVVVSVGHL
jgi:hypothetical protein